MKLLLRGLLQGFIQKLFSLQLQREKSEHFSLNKAFPQKQQKLYEIAFFIPHLKLRHTGRTKQNKKRSKEADEDYWGKRANEMFPEKKM